MSAICPKCGAEYEIGDFPLCAGDPKAHGRPSGSFRPGNALAFAPVVIFRDKRGRVKVPGDSNTLTPAGYEREEIATTRGVRALERAMTLENRIIQEGRAAVEENHHGKIRKENRRKLRQEMKTMSPAGRGFAETAIAINDSRSPKALPMPEVNVEAFAMDKGNREATVSENTGWKRRN